MRSVARVRNWWVRTNHGCIWGCPQCGVGPGPRFSWVRCWSSSGGRVRRCTRAYSTSGTRLSPHCRRHRGCVCCPRNLCGPSLAGRVPPGDFAAGISWVCANDGCRRGCPQCGVRPGHGIGWCAPIVGVYGVVRNAESEPVSGCCGCVVGRVVEVESVGVRGRTRRPVLDFRPTVGVIVAACAVPATSVAPHWQVASRRVVPPGVFMGVRQ